MRMAGEHLYSHIFLINLLSYYLPQISMKYPSIKYLSQNIKPLPRQEVEIS